MASWQVKFYPRTHPLGLRHSVYVQRVFLSLFAKSCLVFGTVFGSESGFSQVCLANLFELEEEEESI